MPSALPLCLVTIPGTTESAGRTSTRWHEEGRRRVTGSAATRHCRIPTWWRRPPVSYGHACCCRRCICLAGLAGGSGQCGQSLLGTESIGRLPHDQRQAFARWIAADKQVDDGPGRPVMRACVMNVRMCSLVADGTYCPVRSKPNAVRLRGRASTGSLQLNQGQRGVKPEWARTTRMYAPPHVSCKTDLTAYLRPSGTPNSRSIITSHGHNRLVVARASAPRQG